MLPSKPCNKKKDEKKRYAPPCEFVSLLLLAHFFGAIRTMVAQRETSSEQSKQALLVAAFFLFFLSPPLSLYLWAPRLYLCPDIQACQSQPRSCGSKSTQPGWSIRRLKLKLFGVHRYKIVIVGGGGKGAAVKARACAHLEMMMTIVTHFRCRQVCPDDTVYPGALCRRIRSDNWRYYYGEKGTSGCRSC